MRSLNYVAPDNFKAFNIMADTPFTRDDVRTLYESFAQTLERFYPGVLGLVEQHDWSLPSHVWGHTLWPIAKAKTLLDYTPCRNFAAVRNGDPNYAPACGTSCWGV